MGFIRELVGYGTLLDKRILPESFPGIGLMGAPAGAFILLGFLIAGYRSILSRRGE